MAIVMVIAFDWRTVSEVVFKMTLQHGFNMLLPGAAMKSKHSNIFNFNSCNAQNFFHCQNRQMSCGMFYSV